MAQGVKEGRILRVTIDGVTEYYSSIDALFTRRTPEELGITYNTAKAYLHRRNGVADAKRCRIEYVTLWVAVRGKRIAHSE